MVTRMLTMLRILHRLSEGNLTESEKLALKRLEPVLRENVAFSNGVIWAEQAFQKERASNNGKASWAPGSQRYDGVSDAPKLIDRERVILRAKRLLDGGAFPHNLASELEKDGHGSARRIRPILQEAGLLPKKKRT